MSRGSVVVNVVPPSMTTSLDRYYLQAATSTSPDFLPSTTSPGDLILNADIAGAGPGRNSGNLQKLASDPRPNAVWLTGDDAASLPVVAGQYPAARWPGARLLWRSKRSEAGEAGRASAPRWQASTDTTGAACLTPCQSHRAPASGRRGPRFFDHWRVRHRPDPCRRAAFRFVASSDGPLGAGAPIARAGPTERRQDALLPVQRSFEYWPRLTPSENATDCRCRAASWTYLRTIRL